MAKKLKYNEKVKVDSITTVEYDRAFRIIVHNPRQANQKIRFDEETVKQVTKGEEEVTVARDAQRHVTTTLTADNRNTQFDLYDPITGDDLNQKAKYEDLQILLHSLYFHLAEQRTL